MFWVNVLEAMQKNNIHAYEIPLIGIYSKDYVLSLYIHVIQMNKNVYSSIIFVSHWKLLNVYR